MIGQIGALADSSENMTIILTLNRYACLVAEPAADSSKSSRQNLVGIVDVTASRDESVMQHLRGAEEYLYVSGIAVSKTFRFQETFCFYIIFKV